MREIKFRAWGGATNEHPAFMMNDISDWAVGDLNSNNWKIMQYTGLSDKNGKEIYEGDLVDEYGNRKLVYRVGFDRGHFTLTDIENGYDRLGIWNVHMNMEIIGNIYQNKDLLTQPQDSQHEEEN